MVSNRVNASSAVCIVIGCLVAGAAAAEVSYTYLEAEYVNIDTDISARIEDVDTDARLTTDNDGGFRVAGAWELYRNWHVFGDYSRGKNDVDFSGTVLGASVRASGDFDVVRWRLGAGYAYPVNEVFDVYGRLSYDYIEFDSFSLSGISQSFDTDDNGLGAEAGVRFNPFEPVELFAYGRYTAVGDVDLDSDNQFDDDTLFGFGARYSITDRIGVQAGYEIGKIDTWAVGARYSF